MRLQPDPFILYHVIVVLQSFVVLVARYTMLFHGKFSTFELTILSMYYPQLRRVVYLAPFTHQLLQTPTFLRVSLLRLPLPKPTVLSVQDILVMTYSTGPLFHVIDTHICHLIYSFAVGYFLCLKVLPDCQTSCFPTSGILL